LTIGTYAPLTPKSLLLGTSQDSYLEEEMLKRHIVLINWLDRNTEWLGKEYVDEVKRELAQRRIEIRGDS
jgi:hypothetical protein